MWQKFDHNLFLYIPLSNTNATSSTSSPERAMERQSLEEDGAIITQWTVLNTGIRETFPHGAGRCGRSFIDILYLSLFITIYHLMTVSYEESHLIAPENVATEDSHNKLACYAKTK